MTDKSPEQILAERISSANEKISQMQSEARLAPVRDGVEDLTAQISQLRPGIQRLRECGYVFGKGMETQADGLAEQWKKLQPEVLREIDRQSPILANDLRRYETQLAQVRARPVGLAIQPAVDGLEQSLETLESKIDAVTGSINGMYDGLKSQVTGLTGSIAQLDKMLAQFAKACFRLLPGEGALKAVKAVYSRDAKMEKEDPDGYLFLTDQRLLFEQNEEIATKKVLFITTEKEKVQKLLLDVPVALVQEVQSSKKGLFGHEDHLALTFQSGAPVYQAWFHLDGQDCGEWQRMIGLARSGEVSSERAVAIDKEEIRKVKEAPSQCPNCGAPITQVVLRGMDSITCSYCQHVVRL